LSTHPPFAKLISQATWVSIVEALGAFRQAKSFEEICTAFFKAVPLAKTGGRNAQS